MDGGFGLDVVNDPGVTYHDWPLLRTLIRNDERSLLRSYRAYIMRKIWRYLP
jgi:hypothetical protein